MRISLFLCAIGVSLMLAVPASGATITFTNTGLDLSGQGFGNATPILTLSPHGNASTESGSVLWDGANDILAGDAVKNKSEALTAGFLLDEGVTADTLGIILNVNEPGPTDAVTLSRFTLTAYSPTGASLFSATYDAGPGGLSLASYDGGQGKAGWLFNVSMSAPEFSTVFGNRDNRLGLSVPSDFAIANAHGGAESFRIGAGPGVGVPEPATISLLILGGIGVLARKMRTLAR